ncbi:MAG TPA: DUF362 domain-containing protein [Armatimonadota bacterium]
MSQTFSATHPAAPPALVALHACPDYDPARVRSAVTSALAALPAWGEVARDGRRVMLKPNLVNPRGPEFAICTHPQVLRVVAEILHEAGCSLLVCDQPAYVHKEQADEVFTSSGYREALAHLPVEWALAASRGYAAYPVPHPYQIREAQLSAWLAEVDAVVNLAKLKTHTQTVLTGAVKNMFGLVAPRQRIDLHALVAGRELSEGIVDTFAARPPEVSLVDAVVAMEGSGPTHGAAKPLGWLAAGADAVAVDAVAASLAGFAPGSIATTVAAATAGYGCGDLERIEIVGADPASLRGHLRPAPRPPEHFPRWLGQAAGKLIYVRPRVAGKLCTRCGRCAAICPAHCISLRAQAVIDRARCLECFCCMEACPQDAIGVQRSLLSRLV